jgi:phosphoribosylamine-glycine ligase
MKTTTKTIAQLEDASNAANSAYDKAVARGCRIDEMIAGIETVLASEWAAALANEDIAIVDPPAMRAKLDSLRNVRRELGNEIDRLETACHEAAHALNDAPEEAA